METEKHFDELNAKDRELWKIAKKRVGFRRHLATYLVTNAMFWLIWYFSEGPNEHGNSFPWPVWPMLGWGIGIIFSYLEAYVYTRGNTVEKEFEKLKNK